MASTLSSSEKKRPVIVPIFWEDNNVEHPLDLAHIAAVCDSYEIAEFIQRNLKAKGHIARYAITEIKVYNDDNDLLPEILQAINNSFIEDHDVPPTITATICGCSKKHRTPFHKNKFYEEGVINA